MRTKRSSSKSKVSLSALCLLCLATSDTAASGTIPSETFSETLLLKPMADGRVLASFDFAIASTSTSTSQFRLLPRPLMQPIQRFGASEVHLSLNTGRWRYDDWGSPSVKVRRRSSYDHATDRSGKQWMLKGEEAVGSGAEVWARFDTYNTTFPVINADGQTTDEESEVYANWRGLTSALAGLFCASLDALDERSTVLPNLAYSSANSNAGTTVHALLPSEGVCTENLTPFLKLLPCKGAAGLSTLLNPLTLFGANFQGLGIHIVKNPSGGWEVRFTFTAVFAPAVTRDVSVRDWSLRSLFGRQLDSACPVADHSVVRSLSPGSGSNFVVKPLPPIPVSFLPANRKHTLPVLEETDEMEDELARAGLLHFPSAEEESAYHSRLQTRWSQYLLREDGEYMYDLNSIWNKYNSSFESGLDLSMTWPNETRFGYPDVAVRAEMSAIQVERTLVGHGQERTTLQVRLTNPDAKAAQNVIWFETFGFFVKPYLHTLKHDVQLSDLGESDVVVRSARDLESPIEHFSYQPSKSSSRKPYVLEALVRIPASSTVIFHLELRKEFVRYSQHPPDAHRGFDLSPGIIFPLAPIDPRTALLHRNSKHPTPQYRTSTTQSRIYTLPKLVELATPDFSFVYTNIIFTSTVIALFFGSTLNTLLRTFRDVVVQT